MAVVVGVEWGGIGDEGGGLGLSASSSASLWGSSSVRMPCKGRGARAVAVVVTSTIRVVGFAVYQPLGKHLRRNTLR